MPKTEKNYTLTTLSKIIFLKEIKNDLVKKLIRRKLIRIFYVWDCQVVYILYIYAGAMHF